MRKTVEINSETLTLLYNLSKEGVEVAVLAKASGVSEFKLRQMFRRVLVNRLKQTKKVKVRTTVDVDKKAKRQIKKDRQEKERLDKRVAELEDTVGQQEKIIKELDNES